MSAVSPLGNPQNIVIASVYRVGFGFFAGCVLPWSLVGVVLLAPYALLLSRGGGGSGGCGGLRPPPPCQPGLRGLAAGAVGSIVVAVGVE